MNRKFQILSTTAAASLMVSTAFAQEPTDVETSQTALDQQQSVRGIQAERLGRAEKASALINMHVENYDGLKLGKVDDIAVDLETGRIVAVILSTGSFAGVGEMLIPIPPSALHHDFSNKVLHLKTDKEKLRTAPRYGTSNWDELSQSNRVAAIYSYYGQQPYFGAPIKSNVEQAPTARLGHVRRAAKLMGVEVMNLQRDKLGQVEEMVLDMRAGRIISVIVSFGGFLGFGEDLSAVPSAAFQVNSENKHLVLDVPKESLVKAPHFKSSEWPDFSEPGYASSVYRAYNVEPYFAANGISEVGDATQNERGSAQKTPTPLDQGNSQADLDITARIRKEILAGKQLSVNARNVKIITNNGQVTLRGPVDTEEEKRLIGVIAIDIARLGNVDNQLVVK